MCLHDYLKRLSSKVCFDASFTSLSRFVSFRVSFNYKCCWTQRCGLFSRIRLWLTDQSWYTGPNESALLFELVFIVWWHQIRKLVRLLSKQFLWFFFKCTTNRHKFVLWRHWNKSSNWKAYLACIYMIFWRDCRQNFVWMFHLGVCLHLLHFVSH